MSDQHGKTPREQSEINRDIQALNDKEQFTRQDWALFGALYAELLTAPVPQARFDRRGT